MLHICLHLNTFVISVCQPETVYFRLGVTSWSQSETNFTL